MKNYSLVISGSPYTDSNTFARGLGINGVGVIEPSIKCPRCMKYDYTGRATGTGVHPNSMEICYDDRTGTGKYTNYLVAASYEL